MTSLSVSNGPGTAGRHPRGVAAWAGIAPPWVGGSVPTFLTLMGEGPRAHVTVLFSRAPLLYVQSILGCLSNIRLPRQDLVTAYWEARYGPKSLVRKRNDLTGREAGDDIPVCRTCLPAHNAHLPQPDDVMVLWHLCRRQLAGTNKLRHIESGEAMRKVKGVWKVATVLASRLIGKTPHDPSLSLRGRWGPWAGPSGKTASFSPSRGNLSFSLPWYLMLGKIVPAHRRSCLFPFFFSVVLPSHAAYAVRVSPDD